MKSDLLNKKSSGIAIKILGVIQVLIGLFTLTLAPLEIYSFYLFREGGRFYYEGFGVGTFLYGLIVAQIIAYYFIGALFLTIGYAHLELKSWAVNFSKACIWAWILFGLPVAVFFFPLLTMKEIEVQQPVLLALLFVLVFIVLIPFALLAFYSQKNVKELFKDGRVPAVGEFLLILVYAMYILFFHVMLFYRGIFPFFGIFLAGFSGIVCYVGSILLALLFIYGLLHRKLWTWILSVSFFVILLISTVITLIQNHYSEIIELLNFPKLEYDIFIKLPVKSSYLIVILSGVLILTLVIIFKSRKLFRKSNMPVP